MSIYFLHLFPSGNPCCFVDFVGSENKVNCYDPENPASLIGSYSWDSMTPVEGQPNDISGTQRTAIKNFILLIQASP
jgi:hypothetical protein